jgi:ribosomal protein L10
MDNLQELIIKLIYYTLHMKKYTALFVALIMCITISEAQNQGKKKKKKKSTTTHVVKTKIAQEALTASDKEHLKNGFYKAAVIDKRGFDGCTFVLKLEDHSTLEPIGLDEKFKVAGKKIWIKFAIAKGATSVCMSGTPVNIATAEFVE